MYISLSLSHTHTHTHTHTMPWNIQTDTQKLWPMPHLKKYSLSVCGDIFNDGDMAQGRLYESSQSLLLEILKNFSFFWLGEMLFYHLQLPMTTSVTFECEESPLKNKVNIGETVRRCRYRYKSKYNIYFYVYSYICVYIWI